MDSSGKSQDVHSRWSANRNTRTALALTAFCALEVILSWKGIGGEEVPKRDAIFLLVSLGVIAWLAQLFVAFKCVRERLVVGVLIVLFVNGFATNVAPTIFGPEGDSLKRAMFALWVVTLAVSLSMLYSSLRFRPPEGVN